mgnify:CR=1 FL=1
MYRERTTEEILSREFITCSDIERLFRIGRPKALAIFDKVQQKVESEGKLNIPGRISWRRMYRMLGLKIPQIGVSAEDNRTNRMEV